MDNCGAYLAETGQQLIDDCLDLDEVKELINDLYPGGTYNDATWTYAWQGLTIVLFKHMEFT